jgi:hypothetical protein
MLCLEIITNHFITLEFRFYYEKEITSSPQMESPYCFADGNDIYN